jgi:metal-sulfur cluster biosynthetic enzyme
MTGAFIRTVEERSIRMAETAIGTIETMLKSALETVDDPDVKYKLRQSLSLLKTVELQHVDAREALEDVELDPEVEDNLRELGYLE